MKTRLQKIALILGGLLMALAVMEVLSRVFWKPISGLPHRDPLTFVTHNDYESAPPGQYVWMGPIGAVKEFHNVSSRNSLGFHDHDYVVPKPEGTFRIVVIGDSFVEAKEVPIPKNFAKILERRLNASSLVPVEVISLGSSGNGALGNLKVLLNSGLRFQPDLVLMGFLSNDPIDDDPRWSAEQKRQNALKSRYIAELRDLVPRYLWLKTSRLNQLLALKTARIVQGIQTRRHAGRDMHQFVHTSLLIFTKEYAEQFQTAWDQTQNYLLEARDIARENGSEFLLVSFPEFWRLGSEKRIRRYVQAVSPATRSFRWDFDKTDRKLESFCSRHSIPFLALTPGFRSEFQKSKKPFHFTFDMHLNERGHELAASLILAWLQETQDYKHVLFSSK